MISSESSHCLPRLRSPCAAACLAVLCAGSYHVVGPILQVGKLRLGDRRSGVEALQPASCNADSGTVPQRPGHSAGLPTPSLITSRTLFFRTPGADGVPSPCCPRGRQAGPSLFLPSSAESRPSFSLGSRTERGTWWLLIDLEPGGGLGADPTRGHPSGRLGDGDQEQIHPRALHEGWWRSERGAGCLMGCLKALLKSPEPWL